MVRGEAVVGRVGKERLDVVAHEGPGVVVEVAADASEGERDQSAEDQLPGEGDLHRARRAQPIERDGDHAEEEEVLGDEDDDGVNSSSLGPGHALGGHARGARSCNRPTNAPVLFQALVKAARELM